MSGVQESPAANPKKRRADETEVAYWDRMLDEYESGIGLPKFGNAPMEDVELEQYLSMDRSQMEALSPYDASLIGTRLQQYAFYLSRSYNRETARMGWAKATTRHELADDIQNYTGVSYEERLNRAIKHNERGKTLYSIHTYAEQRHNRLAFLSNNIKNLADAFFSISYAKRQLEQ